MPDGVLNGGLSIRRTSDVASTPPLIRCVLPFNLLYSGEKVQAGNLAKDTPTNGFVVYEEDWPLRSFKTLEAARQWAERNCRPQDYEIRSGGKAVRDALSLEQIMNTEALW